MKVNIEISEEDLKKLIQEKVCEQLNDDTIMLSDIKIETKSKQNYKSEWEIAAFRASISVNK